MVRTSLLTMDGLNDNVLHSISMPYIFYYLTEDVGNLKELNELSYLRSIGRVVVVTRGVASLSSDINRYKKLNLQRQSSFAVKAILIWTKICFLLARPSNSFTDRGFPLRNIYTGNFAVRWLINHLWPAKYINFINRILPTYENLYFAPFKLIRLLFRDKTRSTKRFQRVVVHDALILRLNKFTTFILAARRGGFPTIANVKSWDNPFYSQFILGASGYLTWSQSMWRDIQRFHEIKTTANHSWGPRPFYNFANAVRLSYHRPPTVEGTLVIGYAAAYCDSLMAAHEVKVVAGMAEKFNELGVNVKLLLRPYPTIPMSIYEPLFIYPNVEIVSIQGPSSDRYGDGREIIRFGSDEERIQYLSRCHCFLSIATSFTFEAAVFGLPVLQYFVPKEMRHTAHELCFFERIDISDHILNYFIPYLPAANSTDELMDQIKTLERNSAFKLQPLELLNVMGFPYSWSSWDEGSAQFVSDLQLL
jgi:hypothetical protein